MHFLALRAIRRWPIPARETGQRVQRYFRAIPCAPGRPDARPLAGGPLAFAEIEVLTRRGRGETLSAEVAAATFEDAVPVLERIEAVRPPICGLALGAPLVMGVVNVTPDSFSDGGLHAAPDAAVAHGLSLAAAGADMLDVGGESTRPGAEPVSTEAELDRVLPVIEGLAKAGCPAPISIDTRNALVARAALAAGARIFNDVSALRHDHGSLAVAGEADAVCLMHARGDPRTMQDAPAYDDVLLDVYDVLAERIAACDVGGLDVTRLIVDPGIGFGKLLGHNLALLRRLSLFHGLGCPILLGASRKGFIGRISGEREAARRAPGSIAAGLAGVAEGVQILRVHDVAETVQAIRVWHAIREGGR